jgi:hypothetical protein
MKPPGQKKIKYTERIRKSFNQYYIGSSKIIMRGEVVQQMKTKIRCRPGQGLPGGEQLVYFYHAIAILFQAENQLIKAGV